MSDLTPAYIDRCIECGGMCAVTVDDGANQKYVQKDVADFMKSGMTINRETVASWNDAPRDAIGHKETCGRAPKRKPRGSRLAPPAPDGEAQP